MVFSIRLPLDPLLRGLALELPSHPLLELWGSPPRSGGAGHPGGAADGVTTEAAEAANAGAGAGTHH